jgi:hypothetical protein
VSEAVGSIWGDGYIPRVSARYRAGIMQALGPSDLFTQDVIKIPYVIVDARLALDDGEISAGFADRNVKVIIDTQSWRYSDPRTWQSKWSTLPYVPSRPFAPTRQWVHEYVAKDLAFQMDMGASHPTLPGWFSSLETVDEAVEVATWTIEAYEQFRRKGYLSPAVAWLPVKSGSRDASLAAAKIYTDSDLVLGIYAQSPKISGLRDPLDRFKRSVKLLCEIQALGIPVIAGHLGAVGIFMRAIGIVAADCGPCTAQSFDFSSSISSALPRPADKTGSRSGAPAVRMWISELGQTVTAGQMAAIRQSRSTYAEVICRRACHRFRLGRDAVSTAAQHGILCLGEEARLQSHLPLSVRADAARRSLIAMKSRIDLVDEILLQGDLETLRKDHLDVQIALLADTSALHGVA